MTKGRKAKNRMTVIEDEEDKPWFEEDQISKVICDFYEKLFTSSPFDGSNTIAEALNPCISDETNESLIKDPTAADIKEATFSIHPDKAPGPDGFFC